MEKGFGKGLGRKQKNIGIYFNVGGLFLAMYSNARRMYSGIAGGCGIKSPVAR